LLEEAKEARQAAQAVRNSPGEGFVVGRAEALAEVLHTWSNQIETFGLDTQLNGVWVELREFLAPHGY
jgi:hypothetical protein